MDLGTAVVAVAVVGAAGTIGSEWLRSHLRWRHGREGTQQEQWRYLPPGSRIVELGRHARVIDIGRHPAPTQEPPHDDPR